MNAVERALRDFLTARPTDLSLAVVGGIAVSARTEPRFTRDLDFAVAVSDDSQAEQYVFQLRGLGYHVISNLEQVARGRLSTIRLRHKGRGPLIDLLFAACGIEPEIVAAAESIEIGAGLFTEVAMVGHLIAMKLVSRDDDRRPQDRADLLALGKVADETEWARADRAVRLIQERSFARNRDLVAALADLRQMTAAT